MTNQILAKKNFFGSPSQIFLKSQKTRQIVSKQVKNRSTQVKTYFFQVFLLQTPFFSAPYHLLLFFSNIFCQNGKKIQISLKMFLKPVWEGKMHGVTKIGLFRSLFCVSMLGKSTNYSTGTRPLSSTF